MASDELSDVTDSAAAHDEGPIHRLSTHRAAARSTAARSAIRAALGGKGEAGERAPAAAAPEPTSPEPATVADEPEPPHLDLNALRLRRERERLASQRGPQRGSHDVLEEYIDRPSTAYRTWLEDMRGEKFASEDEWKTEVADFITHLSTDVLGVPLPPSVRAKFDAAQAKKMVRTGKTVQARRAAAAAEQASREDYDRQWAQAADRLDREIAASADYPLLADEANPGELIIELVRAAHERGESLGWQDAAKQAESYLRHQQDRRASKLAAPKKPAPSKAAPKPAEPATSGKPWNRDAHRRSTLAALRALKED